MAIETDVAFKLSKAAEDVFMERKRQQLVEGWTPEHDDEHQNGAMASAAACYALSSGIRNISMPFTAQTLLECLWPWDSSWWKPKDRRRDLVRAGALIIAEIERIDRAVNRRRG
jgi:hypothetical protein